MFPAARCYQTTDHILAKLADLNLRLRLPRNKLIDAVCRFPNLLGAAPHTVGARVALLVQELGKCVGAWARD
jgi:hypothetical protein